MVKNGRGILLDHGDTNLGRLKITLIIIGWVWSKLGETFLDHETLKSGVFPKWFGEWSRLIEWYLDVDSDGIIFGLIANILCILDM